MDNVCGSRRVIGKKNLPVHGWEIDNSREIMPDEILIRAHHIHLENCNFNQICMETAGQEDLIKETVINMVMQRGKMHNPYTNTAGLIAGTVEEIGAKCTNPYQLVPGDDILILVSASMIPLSLDCVHSVNYAFGNLQVSGHAIIYDTCPVITKEEDIPWEVMMIAFEESASIYNVSRLAEKQKNILMITSNPIVSLLYSNAVKNAMETDGRVIGLFYKNELSGLFGPGEQQIRQLVSSHFDKVYFLDVMNAVEWLQIITDNNHELFDLTINCADQMGAESVSVIATRENGTVFFSTLDNNYNIALFTQEAINREMKLQCAAGYNDGYADYMIEFLRTCVKEAEELGAVLNKAYKKTDIVSHHQYNEPEKRKIIGELMTYKSPKMTSLIAEIEKAAQYDCPVIISGESGTGKEVLANLIFKMTNRKIGPYIKVNCAAIPKELMESEFFGYEKGAFTGASNAGKKGFFDQADGGVLLLDEIAELPVELQAKLLRGIQEGEFYRVGGQSPVRVNVRIIASTNRRLAELIRQKEFREDLYYRLAVITLEIPPLRERRKDVIPLVELFLDKYCQKYGIRKLINEEAMQYLQEHDWPGNIRELENVIQRIIINADESIISSNDVLTELNKNNTINSKTSTIPKDLSFNSRVEIYEKNILTNAFEQYGSTRKVAEALNMTQSQLMRKKQKYNL